MGPTRVRGSNWAEAANCWGQGGNLQTTFRREQEVPLHLWDCRRFPSWPVWTCLPSDPFWPSRLHSPSTNKHHNNRASSGFVRLRKRGVGLEVPRPEHRSIGGAWMYGLWGAGVQVWSFLKIKLPDGSQHDWYGWQMCLQGLRWRPLPSLHWYQWQWQDDQFHRPDNQWDSTNGKYQCPRWRLLVMWRIRVELALSGGELFRDLKRSDIIPQKSDWFSYNMTIDVDSWNPNERQSLLKYLSATQKYFCCLKTTLDWYLSTK